MRFLKLTLLFWKQALIREMEFPKNFWFLVAVNAVHFATQILFIEILFSHTTALAGWSKGDALLFLVTWGIVNSMLLLFCEQSFMDFGNEVHSGQFDFHLLRPVDAQFMVSTRRLALSHIGEPFLYVAILGILIWKGLVTLTLTGILGYALLMMLGVIAGYHLWFALTSVVFWTPYIEHFNFLFSTIASVARYPLEIYGSVARRLFMTFVPIGLLSAVPSEFLLGVGTWLGIVYALVMTVLIILATRLWWKFALRHYASASS